MNIQNCFAPIVIMLILLSGCVAQNAQTPNSPIDNINANLTSTANGIIQPPTTILPSSTLSPNPVTAVLKVNQRCIEIRPNPENRATGVLVFQKGQGSHLVLMDDQGGNQKYIPENESDKFGEPTYRRMENG